jgi:hypothetical protein
MRRAHAGGNAHRFREAIAFFARPRYEMVATGEVFDGAGPLGGHMQENVTAFPDFHYDFTHIHHSGDAIVVEGSYRGTHEGTWRAPCCPVRRSHDPECAAAGLRRVSGVSRCCPRRSGAAVRTVPGARRWAAGSWSAAPSPDR